MIKVSAIIIVYNDERFIARAIQSALSQTYPHLEIIVVDDGSTDRSREIAESYAKQGVEVLGKENGGAASARNLGVRHASGDYLAFLDSDDVWLPLKIEKMMKACAAEADPCLVYSGYHFVDERLRPLMRPFRAESSHPYHQMLQCRNQMLPSTMLLSREIFDAVGGFPEDEDVRGHEDAVFSLLAARRFKAIPVPDPLTLYFYSPSGFGRSAVYDYARNLTLQHAVHRCVRSDLNEDERTRFEAATWINNFCKFAMHGQLASARRIKKEMNINTAALVGSLRGMLAFISAYSRINLLYLARRMYQAVYVMNHKAFRI